MPLPHRQHVNVTGIQGVANSGNAFLKLPNQWRYHSLSIFTTVAGVLADPTTVIDTVKLKVGGITMRDLTAAQIVNIAKLFKITAATGELPIFFSKPWMIDAKTQEMSAWDLIGQGAFTLEIKFLNPGGGAVGIQSVIADVDDIRNTFTNPKTGKVIPFLRIEKMKSETFVFSGAARLGNTTLDKTLPIRGLFVSVSANAISDVEVLADGKTVVHQIKSAEYKAILNKQGIDGTAFELPIVFDNDKRGRSKLTAAQLEVKLTSTGALTATFLNVQEAQSFS
jgi:hypothetical protein